ncbi:MAG: hypothetical protein H6590_01080 [Flavobacteriales bacterium]|nr:hypothetical protein [Flavobacteriales bacterium]
MYTGRDFANGLSAQLEQGFDSIRIAHWAYQMFLNNVHDLEPGLKDKIMAIVLIEEPQFEMSEDELLSFIDTLHA